MSAYTSICLSKNMVLPLNCIYPPPPPPPLIALAAVRSKGVVLLLLMDCLLLPHCLWGSVFDACFTLCPPSFAIGLMRKRKLVALL